MDAKERQKDRQKGGQTDRQELVYMGMSPMQY